NNRFAAGLGQIDWPRIVATLKEVGYDGALTNEFVAPVDRTPAAPYPEMVERHPVDISPEQLKFIQDHGSSVLTEKFYTDQMRITAETLLPLIK
ncbi:MAG: sugar phosphate isomerase/epimerase, partial [Mesorhizobium sp.]